MSDGYPSDWDTRRKRVYERDNYTCQNCGRDTQSISDTSLHAHHIVPKSKGGSHRISNLVALCEDCHNAIHTNSQAPTDKSPPNKKSDLELFNKSNYIIKTILAHIDSNEATIQSPGEYNDERVESMRKQGIKIYRQLMTQCNPSTAAGEEKVEDVIKSGLALLHMPKTVWKKKEKENLSDTQTKKLFMEYRRGKQKEYYKSVKNLINLLNSGREGEVITKN